MPSLRALWVILFVGCSSSPSNPDGGGAGGAGGSGGGSGGSVNRPDAGCLAGYRACSAVCAHVEDDSSHCGACGNACPAGSCVDAGCVASSTSCQFGGAVCGTECISARPSNVNHCGSCSNRCAASELCEDGVCVVSGGNGSSCGSPLLLPANVERNGFFVPVEADGTFVHSCGPLNAIPTRWFRFTGTKANQDVSVKSAVTGERLVLSVFSSSACNAAALVGCSADMSEPNVQVPNALNQTFFVGVGAVQVAPGSSASIRVDR